MEVNKMSDTPYLKILSATIFGSTMSVLPSLYYIGISHHRALEKMIEELKPIVREGTGFWSTNSRKIL